ncbi:MAG: N-acetylmuramoyl-L-alanine amidase [Bacteroidales bacterium]|nr:N-acetylmuramoyl-L-alanine amidase [Bacteroidales bacterium]
MRFVRLLSLTLLLLGMAVVGRAQSPDVFERAEAQCPGLPKGLLRAIAFTNTQCHHLTDADYTVPATDPQAMPRTYGMMGLVKDGKGWFRENLKTVAALSGMDEEAILADPAANVLAYAKACVALAGQYQIDGRRPEDFRPVIEALSELPFGSEKDALPMKLMLYSVYEPLGVDLPAVFGEDYGMLSAPGLSFDKGPDYPPALWVPVPECNYSERTNPVSGVVIHYTEGSYAGCISWFQNCDAQVSAHYVIRSRDGQVTQMVREADKAWHARSANAYTIGIEHEAYGDIVSFFTPEMYASSAHLVRDICSRYESIDGHHTFYYDTLDNGLTLNTGVWDLGGEGACLDIRGHQHYPGQTHTDPGPYWDWNQYYKLINEGTPVIHRGGPNVVLGNFNHVNYGNDERKIWVITSAEHTNITLRFNRFSLERDYDFLWIYDGADVYAPKLGRWNTHSPNKVTSSSNAMCIEFRSDCEGTAAGWEAVWTVQGNNGVGDLALEGLRAVQVGNELQISAPDSQRYEAVLADLYGRVLARRRFSETVAFDLDGLAQGTYLLQVTRTEDGAFTAKRIIR